MEIINLFPTPVLKRPDAYMLSFKQEQFILSLEKRNNHLNSSGAYSVDRYLLDSPILSELKHVCQEHTEKFLYEILGVSRTVRVYITQSWANFYTKNESRHKHFHPNSFLSGVFYVDADPNDDITVYKPMELDQVVPLYELPTPYNQLNCKLSVRPNDLLIFKSTVEHEVEPKQTDNLRVSIAFNTFLKGRLGYHLSELDL